MYASDISFVCPTLHPPNVRNTRYGRLVRPYPTGTCTPQEDAKLCLAHWWFILFFFAVNAYEFLASQQDVSRESRGPGRFFRFILCWGTARSTSPFEFGRGSF